MLNDRADPFYGARLVADARLHLGTVINGGESEAFFYTMCRIVNNNFHLGYRTFNNKEITLSGAKDFIFNNSYGLGIKKVTLSTFLANCAKAAVKDKSQGQYAAKFSKWLGEQYEGFDFPQEFFEFLRIKYYIKARYRDKNRDKHRRLYLLEKLYNQYPQVLQDIGAGKKYKDVFDCAQDLMIWEKKERLKPLSLYRHPNLAQIDELAEKLSVRLDKHKRRALIAKLIEIYKRDELINDSESDGEA